MNNIEKKKKIAVVFLISSLSLITIVACFKLLPFLLSLQEESKRIAFENYIDNLGFIGILLILLIQIIQIFIAFIPGEIIELLAGLLYGTWMGLIICLIGNAIASFLIYLVVTAFAKNKTDKIQEKLKHYSFLNNKKKIATYLFLIYFIPGIPKDIITYLAPFLPINFLTFIIVTSIARIPSIVSSTFSSNSLLNSNYTIAITMLVTFTLIAIIGFIFKDQIINKLKEDNDKEKEKLDNTSK